MTVTRRISKVIKDGIEYNIVGGGSEAVDTCLDTTSENPVQNKVIAQAINGKQDALTAGPNVCIYEENDELKICATDTTYSNATQSSDGLMSASDKKKLDGISIHKICYVVVGGGGGGGGYIGGGGGGGDVKAGIIGGFNNKYNITIGSAGVGGCANSGNVYRQATGGGNTLLQNDFTGETITAKGGCGGCSGCYCSGYSQNSYGAGGCSGSGCTGGDCNWCIGGGGGGAAGNGTVGCCCGQSYGGLGLCGFGGGGEGGSAMSWNTYLVGRCGGGNGGTYCSRSGKNATNYGGGGGGGGYCGTNIGGNGCQGVVDICYPADGSFCFECATGGSKSSVTVGGVVYCRHRFTSNGTFEIIS